MAGCSEESGTGGTAGDGGSGGMGGGGVGGVGGSGAMSPEEVAEFVDAYVGSRLVLGDDGPGLAIVLLGRNGVVFEKSYGMAQVEEAEPFDLDTAVGSASLAKTFTAMAAMILYEDGLVDPSDMIAETFPEAPPAWDTITLHQLLTHQSGIPDHINDTGVTNTWTNEEVLAWAIEEPLEFTPGERMEYSNTGYVLVAMMVERVSGQPFEAFVQERIFSPLGMESSVVTPDSPWPPVVPNQAYSYGLAGNRWDPPYRSSGDGGMYFSVNDLKRFELALRNDAVVSSDTLQRMLDSETPWGAEHCVVGYGFFVCDRQEEPVHVWNQGSLVGWRNHFSRAPDAGVAVIVLSNGRFTWAQQLGYDLYRMYLGMEPLDMSTIGAS